MEIIQLDGAIMTTDSVYEFVMPEAAVKVTVTFVAKEVTPGEDDEPTVTPTPEPEEATTFAIHLSYDKTQGSVVVLVDGKEVTTAASGSAVTVEATPAEGYEVDKIFVVNYETYADIPMSDNTFIMPENEVKIGISFVETSTPGEDDEPTVTPTPEPEEPTVAPTATPVPTETPAEPTVAPTVTPVPTETPAEPTVAPTATPTPIPVEETPAEYFSWTEKTDGTVEISGLLDKTLTEIVIPDEIDGKTVTSIGYSAFSNCSNLSSITIPEGVTSIGKNAFFNCSGLSSITIPEGVNLIDFYTFSGCSNLISITIPSSVTDIDSDAFRNTPKLEELVIDQNNSSYSFQNGALYDKNQTTLVCVVGEQTQFEVPEGVISIGSHAFACCGSFTSITIPSSVTNIDSGAFYNTPGLKELIIDQNNGSYSFLDGALYDKNQTTLMGVIGSPTQFEIPEGVTSINRAAFNGCSSLESITIPESVTSIGKHAFNSCSSLSSITIPQGITSIDDYVFYNCSSLESITIPDGVTAIGVSAFSRCSSLSSVILPDEVVSIGQSAFKDCSNLSSIIIPDGVTAIGDYIFCGCSSLESITIPDGVTAIGDNAFSNCSSLSNVILPDGVVSIGNSAFISCSNLSNVIIPEGVTAIGDYTFSICSNLSSITIPASVESISETAFSYCSDFVIIAPAGSYAQSYAQEKNMTFECKHTWTENSCTCGASKVSSGVDVNELTVSTYVEVNGVLISFDEVVLNQLQTAAQTATGSSLTVSVSTTDSNANTVYDITVFVGGIEISDFDGDVNVWIPCTAMDEEFLFEVPVYYLGKEGEERVTAQRCGNYACFTTRAFYYHNAQ